jgi:hypothetical protein
MQARCLKSLSDKVGRPLVLQLTDAVLNLLGRLPTLLSYEDDGYPVFTSTKHSVQQR